MRRLIARTWPFALAAALTCACGDSGSGGSSDGSSDGSYNDADLNDAGGSDDAANNTDAATNDAGDAGDVSDDVPALPLQVAAILSRDRVAVGEIVYVTCEVIDADGAPWALETRVEADAGLAVTGPVLLAEQPGDFEVTCLLVDGALEAVTAPATLEVDATPATARLALSVEPAQDLYDVGDVITLQAALVHGDGNAEPLAADAVTIAVWPLGAAEPDGDGGWTLVQPGVVGVEVRLVEDPAVGAGLVLIVDRGAPSVVLTSPSLPHWATEATGVEVTGRVTHSAPLSALTLDGEAIEVDDAGLFAASVPAVQGLNVVVVEATDALERRGANGASWLQSTVFHPVSSSLDDLLEAQVLGRLGPEAASAEASPSLLDAFRLGPLLPEITPVLVSGSLGRGELYQGPEVPGCFEGAVEWEVDVLDRMVRLDLTEVSRAAGGDPVLTFREGGVDLSWQATLSLTWTVTSETTYETGDYIYVPQGCTIPFLGKYETTTRQPVGELTVEAAVDLQGSIELAKARGLPLDVLPVVMVSVDLGAVSSPLSSGTIVEVGAATVTHLDNNDELIFPPEEIVATAPLVELFPGIVGGPGVLLDAVGAQGVVEDQLRSLFLTRVGALASLFLSPQAQTTAAFGPEATPVDVALQLDTLSADSGALDLTYAGAAATAPAPSSVSGPGALGRAGCLVGDEPALEGDGVAFHTDLDLFNHTLHAAWLAAPWPAIADDTLLELLQDHAPDDTTLEDVALWPELPPVVTDCTGDGSLELQAGDLIVVASFSDGDATRVVTTSASAFFPATLDDAGERFALFVDAPQWLDLRSVTDGEPDAALNAAAALIAADALSALLVDGLAVPAIDLVTVPAFDWGLLTTVPSQCNDADDCPTPADACLTPICQARACRYPRVGTDACCQAYDATEGFEGELTWATAGACGWALSDARASQGASSLYYGLEAPLTCSNFNATATSDPLTLPSRTPISLALDALGVTSADDVDIAVSIVDGLGETRLGDAESVPRGDWGTLSRSLDAYAGQTVRLRVRLIGSGWGEGIYMDNVRVTSLCE